MVNRHIDGNQRQHDACPIKDVGLLENRMPQIKARAGWRSRISPVNDARILGIALATIKTQPIV